MKQTILITGASSGIGKATAKFFQSKGWNVIATMRSPELESELTQLDSVLVQRLDVEDASSIRTGVEAGLKRFGKIDVLLNNAGYGAYGPLEATPIEKIRKQYEVNVIGLMATTKALLPHFRENRNGHIVNISSIGGKVTFPLGTLYHGTKFAVEGLSEALHYELQQFGVKVKIVEPGMINTDFAGRSFDFSNDAALTEYQPVVQSLMSALGPMTQTASLPSVVAEVIYKAVTDGTDQLRYEAGQDAVQILSGRRAVDDDVFIAGIKAQFGI